MSDSIDNSDVIGQRDKALLATLAYTCSRISAVVNLNVEVYFQNGKRPVLRLSTKDGKENEFPLNHVLEEILDSYRQSSGLLAYPTGPPFPTTRGRSRELGIRAMTEIDAARLSARWRQLS
jgi:site-specific recombinase XerD